jgi:hypothetical protein
MASSISLPSFAAKSSNILNPDGTTIDQSFAPVNGSMFRNRIINGNFDVWQRATTQTGNEYGSADRYTNNHNICSKTVSRQAFTLGQTSVPNNPKYHYRCVVVDGGVNAANYCVTSQRIEDVSSFSGQTVTISFWAKADATKNIATSFSQIFGTGGSPSTAVGSIGPRTFNLTTAWQKFTASVAIPSVSGKTLGSNLNDYLEFNIWFAGGSATNASNNSLGQQSGTFDISSVQIEAGSSATTFELRPVGTELALCQRYYEKSFDIGTAPAANTGDHRLGLFHGLSATTAGLSSRILFKVMKRSSGYSVATYNPIDATNPTSWRLYTGSWQYVTPAGVSYTQHGFLIEVSGGSGLTASTVYFASGHWAADNEL